MLAEFCFHFLFCSCLVSIALITAAQQMSHRQHIKPINTKIRTDSGDHVKSTKLVKSSSEVHVISQAEVLFWDAPTVPNTFYNRWLGEV